MAIYCSKLDKIHPFSRKKANFKGEMVLENGDFGVFKCNSMGYHEI